MKTELEEAAENYARKQCDDMYDDEGLTGANWGWEVALDFKRGAKWQKNNCVQFIDKLEDESFDGWSEEAISGYLTACTTIKEQFKKK